MKHLTIGFVLDDTLDSSDGVQQYILTLGQWLSKRGHSVHYLVGETKRSDIDNIHSLAHNLKVRFNRNRLSLPLPARSRNIRDVLEATQFDVLHVQMPFSPFLAGKIIKQARPKTAIVGTFHILPFSGWFGGLSNRLLAAVERNNLNKFNIVCAVSDAAQEFLANSYGLKSVVIPNAVALSKFNKPHSISSHADINITFLGRLVARKGCIYLLRAVKALSEMDNLPNFKVTIAGDGPLRGELEKYVFDNKLTNRVNFLGYVSESVKARLLASSDISVFPSVSGESFGIVLVEAMASGRSVVLGGNNPGYRFVLNSNKDLLFDPLDNIDLVAKLARLLKDPSLRHDLAAWCKNRATEFEIDKIGPKIEALYLEACKQAPNSR